MSITDLLFVIPLAFLAGFAVRPAAAVRTELWGEAIAFQRHQSPGQFGHELNINCCGLESWNRNACRPVCDLDERRLTLRLDITSWISIIECLSRTKTIIQNWWALGGPKVG
jgi:hypothetical protein